MIDLGLVLPLALFVILAALFIVVLRRASAVFAEVRRAATFRDGIDAVANRADAGLGALAELTEPLRRPADDPLDEETLTGAIAAAREAVLWGRERTRELIAPAPLEIARTTTMDELARAEEAIRAVEHGVSILTSTAEAPRAREGRTAIKRGYLRLMHARDGLLEQATRTTNWRAAGENSIFGRRLRFTR